MIYIHTIESECEITSPNSYFNRHKKKEWFNDPVVKEIIKNIDNTIAVKDEYLESPVFGGMAPERLSGGCKMVILAYVLDDVIWGNGGDNCFPEIQKIGRLKDVHLYMTFCPRVPDDFEAYILCRNGSIYKNIF